MSIGLWSYTSVEYRVSSDEGKRKAVRVVCRWSSVSPDTLRFPLDTLSSTLLFSSPRHSVLGSVASDQKGKSVEVKKKESSQLSVISMSEKA